jgi:hypothetical protein
VRGGSRRGVFPRGRSIVEARDIVFPHVSKRKLAHGVGYDFQRSAGPHTFVSLVFLKLNSRLLDDRLRELYARTRQPCVDEQERRRHRLHATPAHHEVIARNPERNRDAVLGRLCHKRLEALRVFAAEHELAARKIERRQEMVEQGGADHAVDALHPKPC